ncbi:MAG TPA: 3-phosphoshikimate 1-carboxyvinyltransferase [Elusimicrobia bacterium]|nr:3-phosphoshikimate 1-carboxyvinyltransferase [Elusimicrobiota bacterium]HBT60366.1 3-phosphoshikimate 1-carboxyvinyltransferase [Elusimicrobiota bacterium]
MPSDPLEIRVRGRIDADVPCPRSKGFSNRALILAALARGQSRLSGILRSDDTERMLEGLRAFGAGISWEGDCAMVRGLAGAPEMPKREIYVGGSGTAARFLCALAGLGTRAALSGDARMRERPMEDLAEALRQLGVEVETTRGCLPLRISGGRIRGGRVVMRGGVSSQFLSALMMALPCAEQETVILVPDDLTSKSYADMTISMMEDFGCRVENRGYKEFFVPRGVYQARDYAVEGDAANAAYFFAAAAVTGGRVRVTGLRPRTRQGEIQFVEALERMGCSASRGPDWIEVSGGRLQGIDIDMNNLPDAAQTLAVVAAFAQGPTIVRHVENLRLKETDRIAAVSAELRKLGCAVEEAPDGFKITPGPLHGACIETYHDHRMAMSFAVAGLALRGVRINDPACVNKTFPDFFAALERLR